MKSGKKIYRRILRSGFPDTAGRSVRDLGNGSLRSLVLHLTRTPYDSQAYEQVLAMAMCEVVRRFLDRGRKIL